MPIGSEFDSSGVNSDYLVGKSLVTKLLSVVKYRLKHNAASGRLITSEVIKRLCFLLEARFSSSV
jgi:hypothetical protein